MNNSLLRYIKEQVKYMKTDDIPLIKYFRKRIFENFFDIKNILDSYSLFEDKPNYSEVKPRRIYHSEKNNDITIIVKSYMLSKNLYDEEYKDIQRFAYKVLAITNYGKTYSNCIDCILIMAKDEEEAHNTMGIIDKCLSDDYYEELDNSI